MMEKDNLSVSGPEFVITGPEGLYLCTRYLRESR